MALLRRVHGLVLAVEKVPQAVVRIHLRLRSFRGVEDRLRELRLGDRERLARASSPH